MEDGVLGAAGVLVRPHVIQELLYVHVNVIILYQEVMRGTVRELSWKRNHVIMADAQV